MTGRLMEHFDPVHSMTDVPCVPMKNQQGTPGFRMRDEPAVESHFILGNQEDVLVLKPHHRWTGVDVFRGIVDEEALQRPRCHGNYYHEH
jgi:hypothetical protein